MIYSILVGALIGWIASRLMGGKKGLLRYLILGVAGSRLGGGQFPRRGDRYRRAQLDRRDPDWRGRRVRRDSSVQMAV